eukprot:12777.XXX_643395_643532_1 [CDS] Oithona nana genome sequencing.
MLLRYVGKDHFDSRIDWRRRRQFCWPCNGSRRSLKKSLKGMQTAL